MKTNWLKISSALSLVMTSTLLTACGAGDMNEFDAGQMQSAGEEGEVSSEEIELGSVEQGLHNCSNPDGTNNVMAALAVAAAKELGRWRAEKDFVVVGGGGGGTCTDIPPDYTYTCQQQASWGKCNESWMIGKCNQSCGRCSSGGGTGAGDRIALHPGGTEIIQPGNVSVPIGRSRCQNGCKGIDALLALQNDNATGVYVQGETSTTKVLVNPGALRSRMKAKLEEQINKATNFMDGSSAEGARTTHTLTAAGSGSLGGCGPHFKYNVTFAAPAQAPKVPLAKQLRYSLYFADQANGWVDFRENVDGVANRVAIDPTYGLSEGSSTSAGACEVACTKLSTNANPAGLCCSCGGVQKTFRQSAFSTSLFLCQ